MAALNVGSWVRTGLWALPIYGVLTLWTTFIHQPDLNADFEAYARYVSTTNYLFDHLFGSILGVTLAIFGAVALGAYLSSRRSALIAMFLSVAGNALILTVFGTSTFATHYASEAPRLTACLHVIGAPWAPPSTSFAKSQKNGAQARDGVLS